jgi:outer membrane protein insertion porin family
VDVKEKPTGAFTIGGGYSSLDGVIFQGSVSQANFLGLGLKANLSAAIGGRSTTYALGLTDPYFLDSKWTLGADIYRSERDYTDYSRRLTGGDIKAANPITDFISTFWMY